jgi:tetratricopeptide (TPR) repeat protein
MSKRNKKKESKSAVPLSAEGYIRKKARTLPIFECLINSDWKKGGMADIIIARRHINGNITLGFYLVDILCLGVKDSFYSFNILPHEYENLKREYSEELKTIKCNYALVHNIIYGAVEFAEEFGFHPHKDFLKITVNILEEDDEKVELIDIEFGQNGKPCLIVGPDHNYATEIAMLEKSAGPGNYEVLYVDSEGYLIQDGFEYSDDDELDEDDVDEETKAVFQELESMDDWTDEEWKDFKKGKKRLSDKAMMLIADLIFYSQYKKDEVEGLYEEMENLLDLEITYDPINTLSGKEDYFNDKNLSTQLLDSYEAAAVGNHKKAIQILMQLIAQYPDYPVLYANLATNYMNAGKKRKAEDIIIYLYQKFPDYLFAKIHYSLYLILQGKVNDVARVLENKWTLPDLLPGRTLFHSSEVKAFHTFLVSYYLKTDQILKADVLFKLLREYDLTGPNETQVEKELQFFKMMCLKTAQKNGMDAFSNDFKEENYMKVMR